MPMKNINRCKKEELIAYARDVLQIDGAEDIHHFALVAKIRDLVKADVIEVDEVLDEEPMTGNPDPTHYSNDPKVVIEIASDDGKGGERPFPIACNGVQFWVERNKQVPIPYRLYLILENAVQTRYRQVGTAGVDQRMVPSDSKICRYTVHQKPTQDEIDDWHARTRDINRAQKDKLRKKKLAA